MALPHNFDKTLSKISDETIFEMAVRGKGYTLEAIAAARGELTRRNLSAQAVTALDTSLRLRDGAARKLAEMPLPWKHRVLFFVCGCGLPLIILGSLIASGLGAKGYTRRENECWSWMLRGLSFSFLAGMIASILGSLCGRGDRLPDVDWPFFLLSALLSLCIVLGLSYLIDRRRAALRLVTDGVLNT